jgi:hypothetical protein
VSSCLPLLNPSLSRPVCCDRPRKESQQPSCTYILSELLAPSNCQVLCPHLASPPTFPRAPTFPPTIDRTDDGNIIVHLSGRGVKEALFNTGKCCQQAAVNSTCTFNHCNPPGRRHHRQLLPQARCSPLGTPRSAPRHLTNRPSFFVLPALAPPRPLPLLAPSLWPYPTPLCSNHPPIDLFCHHLNSRTTHPLATLQTPVTNHIPCYSCTTPLHISHRHRHQDHHHRSHSANSADYR